MNLINKILYNLSSLTTSLWCLGIYFILVLIGTFAQIEDGIFYVQKIYFNSFFLYTTINGLTFPYFPGGALVGFVLVLNLILSTIIRIQWNWKKSGILLVHLGLIILLIGAGMTSCVSSESQIYLKENDSTFFAKDTQKNELVIIDATHPQYDELINIPASTLKPNATISNSAFPFTIKVHEIFKNVQLFEKHHQNSAIQAGIGTSLGIKEIPEFTSDSLKNNQACILSFETETYSSGTMLFALDINGTQQIIVNGKPYYIQLRPKHHYFPFTIKLKTFTQELYPGSTIPKHYSSLVEIQNFNSNQSRDVLIYMNHPLRHQFYTFFQASFGQDEPSSVLQVVYNPIWLLPYVSCIIISLGLIIQFLIPLSKLAKRKPS